MPRDFFSDRVNCWCMTYDRNWNTIADILIQKKISTLLENTIMSKILVNNSDPSERYKLLYKQFSTVYWLVVMATPR